MTDHDERRRTMKNQPVLSDFPYLLTGVALTLLAGATARSGPADFGRQELDAALSKAGLVSRAGDLSVIMAKSGAPETYTIKLDGRRALIQGGDAAGVMYGELEMAERNSYDYIIHSGTKEQDFLALLSFWGQAQRKLQTG